MFKRISYCCLHTPSLHLEVCLTVVVDPRPDLDLTLSVGFLYLSNLVLLLVMVGIQVGSSNDKDCIIQYNYAFV